MKSFQSFFAEDNEKMSDEENFIPRIEDEGGGEQNADGGAQEVDDGSTPQIDVGEQHVGVIEQHVDGGEQHVDGGEQHIDGGEQHVDGGEQHIDGGEQHVNGGEQHVDGQNADKIDLYTSNENEHTIDEYTDDHSVEGHPADHTADGHSAEDQTADEHTSEDQNIDKPLTEDESEDISNENSENDKIEDTENFNKKGELGLNNKEDSESENNDNRKYGIKCIDEDLEEGADDGVGILEDGVTNEQQNMENERPTSSIASSESQTWFVTDNLKDVSEETCVEADDNTETFQEFDEKSKEDDLEILIADRIFLLMEKEYRLLFNQLFKKNTILLLIGTLLYFVSM
jgi:hypothetical protein